MTTARLIQLLLSKDPDTRGADLEILPIGIYCIESQDKLDETRDQIRTLQKQRDELKTLLPHRAEVYDEQFAEEVRKLANELHHFIVGDADCC